MNRRDFFKHSIIGSGALVVTGCGSNGWRAHRAGSSADDSDPFAPWHALASMRLYDPAVLPAAAILASNPHNTQPWTMTAAQSSFQIQADTARHLGVLDPYQREMWIGLGCAIANAEVAAAAAGFRTGPPKLAGLAAGGVGRIALSLTKVQPNNAPLAPSIQERRTNRAPYLNKQVPADVLDRIIGLAGTVPGASVTTFDRRSPQGQAFSEHTLEATRAINADQQMSHDAHVWFRSNAHEVAQHRDGVSIPTAGLAPAITFLGQFMPETNKEKSGEYWLLSTKRQLENTSGLGLIMVEDKYKRHSQIAAGRLWQRLHLAFTAEGLAAQPMNQLPELVDRDRELRLNHGWRDKLKAISGPKGSATLAFRFGYPSRNVPHSARRPLGQVLTLAT